MLIAHLPAGYLLARRIAPRLAVAQAGVRRLMALGLAGSVLPDIDLVYFYLVDGRQTLHHDYWTHIPAFWAAAMLAATAMLWLARIKIPWREVLILLAGIFLHLVLDTLVGGIAWGWPVSQHLVRLIDVPARFDWWVWNFVLHWSFILELAVVAFAAIELGVVPMIRGLKNGLANRILARRDPG